MEKDDHRLGADGREDNSADLSPGASAARGTAASEVDPAFARLWATEWEEHVRQSAITRIKRRVSARQFQLFDLHVLQGLSVREAAAAAGSTMAAVYVAKSRVGRLFKREAANLASDKP